MAIWYNEDNPYLKRVPEDTWQGSFRIFLLEALELTKKGNVLEMGCGRGSSPLLQSYCRDHNRKLYSYDNNEEWAKKFNSTFIGTTMNDWELCDYALRDYSVALIDHSPGFHRPLAVERLRKHVGIFIMHDTQPISESGYCWNNIWDTFRYVTHYKKYSAWATAASDIYDINMPPTK
jgi:hypothetical protein